MRPHVVDVEITGAIVRALAHDGRVNSADMVHVWVDQRRAYLSGTVRSAEEKRAAEETARSVPGVVAVENDLTVTMDGTIADAELREQVLNALAGTPHLAPRVGCTVDDGVVRLVGHVRDAGEEREAIAIAGAIKGVEQVVSDLEIAAIVPDSTELPADDATLQSKLNEALANAAVDIRNPGTFVKRGVAYLEGMVGSEDERRRAQMVAEQVDGIRAVRNRLVLRLSRQSTEPDEALAARLLERIARDGRVSVTGLQLFTIDGIVYVSGQVDSIDDQNALLDVLRGAPGVREVDASQVVVMNRTSTRSDDKGRRWA